MCAHFDQKKEKMLNLYGDLPPPSSSNSNDEKYEEQGSLLSVQQPVKTASNVSSAAPGKPFITLKPSSLAFKPRQTKANVVPPSNSANLSGRGGNNIPEVTISLPIIASENKNSDLSIQNAEKKQNTTKDAVKGKENNFIEEENDEFKNKNTSFEVSEQDAYNPRRPNDYIAYCEERLQQRKAAKLAEENRRLLEEQERAREQLQQERRDAVQRGDYDSLVSGISSGRGSATPSLATGAGGEGFATPGAGPVGRGRGRGNISNLPSWMTQGAITSKPAAAAELAPPPSAERFEAPAASISGVKRKQGMFSKPSCVLLLKNMVSAEEVDDALADETSAECLKYGPVASCLVQTLPTVAEIEGGRRVEVPEVERVRTFVKFEKQESAVRAYRDLNGRFFGGRQISASFFDEDKFDRMDLIPTGGEW